MRRLPLVVTTVATAACFCAALVLLVLTIEALFRAPALAALRGAIGLAFAWLALEANDRREFHRDVWRYAHRQHSARWR